jgi:dienelactone hydrolase
MGLPRGNSSRVCFARRLLLTVILPALILGSPAVAQGQEEEDLNVFWKWARWNNPGGFLIEHLIGQADLLYASRDRAIEELKTRQDWLARQDWVRSRLAELIGPFPERGPLNPRVTGIIRKPGYRIEKLVYESMPGFHVPGCLFIPEDREPRMPAILNVIGHNQDAFRDELYQIVYLNLVKKGFVVLAIDPIGQGEHVQYFDPEIGFSSIGYSVIEHCYFGNQCFLAGYSPARYFTWDAIRGIDYLVSRDEVDAERIGVAGFSGGGTVTAYVSALDERVKAAAASSWSVASRRQTETKGTQDAESVFVHGLLNGITFEDLVEVRAPKPTLLTFTTRDEYLSIQGAREAYREIAGAYREFGAEADLVYVEDDFEHWMTPRIRTAIYGFFQKHLGVTGSPQEEPVEFISKEELRVTPTGQALTWLGGESVFSVNRRETEKLLESLAASRSDIPSHLDRVRGRARQLSGYREPREIPGGLLFNGRYQRDGYSVGKYAVRGEGDYMIPFLLFVPAGGETGRPAVVYLHPGGKTAEAGTGGKIEQLVRKGYVVAAPDLLGAGQTENLVTRRLADDYTALNIGRSLVGIQAGDIVRVVRRLEHLAGVDPKRIAGVGVDEMCIPLLHAAAFDSAISRVVLLGSPISYRSISMNRFYRIGLVENRNGGIHHPYEVDFGWGVAGALTAYDLPDLIGCLAARKVVLAGLRNELLEPATDRLVSLEIDFPRRVYSDRKVPENLRVLPEVDDLVSLLDWCFE